ncbi:MAG: PGF-CTERM sorting domain-containing protein [Methanolobus sp.]|nr:PGF-CTERM sorting domain-containing protein [Methanolobus sp.]
MLIIAGPASAITMKVDINNNAPTQGEEITFTVKTKLAENDKFVPMTNLSLVLTKEDGSEVENVLFTPEGTLLSDNTGISIDPINPASSSDYGYGYGEAVDDYYGYGYGYGTEHSFGYGYGYGYGYGAGGATTTYEYEVTVNTTTFDTGEYLAQVFLNTGNADKPAFESPTTEFTVKDKVFDISGYVGADGNVSNEFRLAAASGNTTLIVPPGTKMLYSNGSALNTSITMGTTTPNSTLTAALGSSENVVGKSVKLGPAGATFDPHIQVRFNYTDDDISGIDENTLAVKFYNQITSQWDLQTTIEHNKTGNYIIASIEHFSTFAVTGTAPVTTPPPTRSSSSGGGTGGALRIVGLGDEDATSPNETDITDKKTEMDDKIGTGDKTPISDPESSGESDEGEDNNGIPGFEAILGISGLLAVALYTRRESRK